VGMVLRNFSVAIGFSAMLVAGCVGGRATAVEIPLPHFNAKFSGRVEPKTLPKRGRAPIALVIHGDFSTIDGSQPPSLREATVDFDRDGVIDPQGLPVCRLSQLEGHSKTTAPGECAKAIVGSGTARIDSSITGQQRAMLTAFNGGARGDTTTILVRSVIVGSAPAHTVAVVKVNQIPHGPYGLRSVWKLPRLLGGAGSLLEFSLKLQRLFKYKSAQHSYLAAKCPDGTLTANVVRARFIDEANSGIGDQSIVGAAAQACTASRG
jgi:hypothetical protein